jgi:hypothetical protein
VCPRNFYSWPPQNERCSRDHPLHRLPHALATAISNTSCQDLSCPSPHLKINLLEATDPASSRVTFLTCRWYIDVDFDRAGVHAMRHLCRLHARHTRQELSHSSHAYRLTCSAIMIFYAPVSLRSRLRSNRSVYHIGSACRHRPKYRSTPHRQARSLTWRYPRAQDSTQRTPKLTAHSTMPKSIIVAPNQIHPPILGVCIYHAPRERFTGHHTFFLPNVKPPSCSPSS